MKANIYVDGFHGYVSAKARSEYKPKQKNLDYNTRQRKIKRAKNTYK